MMKSPVLDRPNLLRAVVLVLALISMSLVGSSTPASALSLAQCNGTDNVGGEAVECHYEVTNTLNGSQMSSSTTLIECHGDANAPQTMTCSDSTTTSTELVTVINQCNGSGNGGGGQVTCTVDVINNIVGTVTPTAATVNQCNASGTGGGTQPTILCSPYPANTTNATVTQCNESGTEGGGTVRVQCTVDVDSTTSSVLSVTVNQCNGSGAEGGATVTCRTGITNNVIAPPTDGGDDDVDEGRDDDGSGTPSTPTDERPVRPGAPRNADGPGTPGGPDGPAAPGTPGAPSERTTSQITRVPTGGADAGGGSTSPSSSNDDSPQLIGLSVLLAALWTTLRVQKMRDSA